MKIFAITDKVSLQCKYIGLHVDAESAWQIYLGWPDQQEIRVAKMSAICEEVNCYPAAQMLRT